MLKAYLKHRLFSQIAEVASQMGVRAHVVGGWVRDCLMDRPSKDLDVVVEGSGIEMATRLAEKLRLKQAPVVFSNFGTAMIRYRNWEMEFVGARRESYRSDSRKPQVEEGTFEDDLKRRDFTINALAVSLNHEDFGQLTDRFNGLSDLKEGIIRTPLNPIETFSDDPLRMMRAVRFATLLDFRIDPLCLQAIKSNAHRLDIVSVERIMDEFNRMLQAKVPSRGILLLHETGLLGRFFPELEALRGVEEIEGKGHKDNLLHTLAVLDNVAARSDDLWLRYAALLHDIAKPRTKKFDEQTGWSFHGHEYVGYKMVRPIFRRLRLPQNEKMKFVEKMVLLHLRPIVLSQSEVSDSAVRRLLFEAGEDIDQLMLLCEADITSGNREKVRRFLRHFEGVRQKLHEIEEKDRIRNWQPPVSGDDIMKAFGLQPGREVGVIKTAIREAILDGEISNDREEALAYMMRTGEKMGLRPAPS